MARRPASMRPTLAENVAALNSPAMIPTIQIPNLRKSQRTLRSPKEDFFTIQRPFDIQLTALHPVLAGETMTNMLLQSRVLTDPIVHRLSGWWCEYYLFYVKHTDLAAATDKAGEESATVRDDIIDMHLTGNALALADATRRDKYYKTTTMSAVDWGKLVTEAVTRWYFRDAAEGAAGYFNYGQRTATDLSGTGGTVYKCRAAALGWMDSFKIEDVNPTGNADAPGIDGFIDLEVPTAWQAHYDQYEYMRQNKMLVEDYTFEDYLATFGVKVPERVTETQRQPELLRYMRSWQYPSSTIDPTTSAAASAVSWAITERADKARAFSEPGFLALFTVIRPKIFFGNQKHHATIMLDDPYAWLPAVLRDHPFVSLIEYDHNEGPVSTVLNALDDYWVDRRDLFTHGGQFLNFAPSNSYAPVLDLPASAGDSDLNLWYASDANIMALFVDNANTNQKTYVRQDGICRFTIKSAPELTRDHT